VKLLLKPFFYFLIIVSIISLTSISFTPILGEEFAWKSTNITTKPSLDQPAKIFNIQYRISNGSNTFQAHDYTFSTDIHSKTKGIFEIKIPKNFPYYVDKNGPDTKETYLVLENGGQITLRDYNLTNSDCFFTYSIPFNGNSTITVLSTNTLYLITPLYGDKVPAHCLSETIIPEFPFAIPILMVSITSLILFYRIKFQNHI